MRQERFEFDHHGLVLSLVRQLRAHRNTDEAIWQLERLLTHFPGSFEAWLLLGDICLDADRYDDAYRAFSRLTELHPEHIEANVGLIKASQSSAKKQATYAKVTTLLRKSASVTLREAACDLLRAMGRDSEIQPILEEGIRLNPSSVALQVRLSRLLVSSGDAEKGVDILNHSINNLKGASAGELLEFAQLCSELGAPDAAVHAIRCCAASPQLSGSEIAKIGRLLSELGMSAESQSLLKASLCSVGGEDVLHELLRSEGRGGSIKHRVVFVCEYAPRAREVKIAAGLRGAGWEVILLYKQPPNFPFESYFTETKQFKTPDEAVYLVSSYRPQLCHIFALAGSKTDAHIVRERVCPTVFDTNDIFEGFFNQCLDLVHLQRYCIEHADGLCCRDIQINFVARRLGYKKPKRTILFTDYCWGGEQGAAPRPDSAGVSVVVIGNFVVDPPHGEATFADVASCFVERGVEFHLYPHWFYSQTDEATLQKTFPAYYELAKKTELFKLHRSLPMDQVVPEIRRFDFGLHMQPMAFFPERGTYLSQQHLWRGAGGRNADYLDAGLGILMSKCMRFNYHRLHRYGVILEADTGLLTNLAERLKAVRESGIRERAYEAARKESLAVHIPRLVQFYDSLAN